MIERSTRIPQTWQELVSLADQDFVIDIQLRSEVPVTLTIQTETVADLPETWLLRVKLSAPDGERFEIERMRLHWQVPAVDAHGLYFGGDPRSELGYLPFFGLTREVAAHTGLPFIALIHRSAENRVAYGLLDQLTETRMTAELSEITRCYHMTLSKPANGESIQQCIPASGEWEEIFFVSKARNHWPEVLAVYAQQVMAWMDQPAMPVPEHAYDPVFCTWTAIHHDVSHEWIMKNAPLAADLGFRTWLTDDGWFIEKGEFGKYERVGEWLPDAGKFPDLKAHVEAVQALGFRYVLWVAPFMIGEESRQAQAYAHLLTTGQVRERFRNLSPWHAETKTIISDLLQRLVQDYGLDGLKIDFIDSIRIDSEKRDGASDETLGRSIYEILQAAIDPLLSSNPDLLIEFRNRYTNLASRRYGNIYRSSDVPINFTLNRWQTVMLRLLTPDRAVHMDPMLWHPDDTDENVAVHLINGIASVPMVSIELDQYPQSHLDLIRYWIGFYQQHRRTLVKGGFRPRLAPTHIPLIEFVGEDELITGLYSSCAVRLYSTYRTQWILNASEDAFVEFEMPSSVSGRVISRNKFGHILFDQTYTELPSRLQIEIGGSLEIRMAG